MCKIVTPVVTVFDEKEKLEKLIKENPSSKLSK